MLFKVTIDALFTVFTWIAGYFPDISINDNNAIVYLVNALNTFNGFISNASWWFPVNFAWQVFIFSIVIESTFTGFFILIRFIEIAKIVLK
jgi:hypothetical protein